MSTAAVDFNLVSVGHARTLLQCVANMAMGTGGLSIRPSIGAETPFNYIQLFTPVMARF